MSDEPVYRWPKNSREEVRASLTTYRGHRLADIRVYVADDGDGDGDHPTKKGLAVRVQDLPRLREAVDALIEAHEEERAA
jgi:Transcriptional Coactivator p15 (PC4)